MGYKESLEGSALEASVSVDEQLRAIAASDHEARLRLLGPFIGGLAKGGLPPEEFTRVYGRSEAATSPIESLPSTY